MYPMAMATVKSECKNSWSWFLEGNQDIEIGGGAKTSTGAETIGASHTSLAVQQTQLVGGRSISFISRRTEHGTCRVEGRRERDRGAEIVGTRSISEVGRGIEQGASRTERRRGIGSNITAHQDASTSVGTPVQEVEEKELSQSSSSTMYSSIVNDDTPSGKDEEITRNYRMEEIMKNYQKDMSTTRDTWKPRNPKPETANLT
ncbi:hypothetical protein ACH5RR_018482 [Cinchona calisaya]|uniref:Uncharacterized protein n=1 Tax=Cinchona calisaya TaxID=153742 RepID=A0ABD2ZM15_9GENT